MFSPYKINLSNYQGIFMSGFITAGVAFLVLILFIKFKPTLSESEYKELKGIPDVEEEEESRSRIKSNSAANLLIQVIEDGTVEEIQQTIANGIDIRQKVAGQTLLHVAAKSNTNPDVIQFLLNQGIEINDVNEEGQSALMLAAAFNSNPDIITMLLENGADKKIKDKTNKTAEDYVILNSSFFGTDIPNQLKI